MELADSSSDLTGKDKPTEFVFDDRPSQEAFGLQLNLLRKNREFCDVTLQVGPHEIVGHKCVLAVASPRLFQLFARKDGLSTYDELEKWGLEYEPLEKLVDFAYTCRLEAKDEDVRLLFRTASKLQMDRVVRACGEYLIDHVNIQNCVGVRSIINREYTALLADKIDAFIKDHFAEAVLQPDFIALPRVQIEVIQRSEQEANQTNEYQLCQMGVDWIRKCMVDDEWTLSALTEKVHLLFLKDDDSNYTLYDCLDLDEQDVQEKELYRATMVQDYKILSKTFAAPQHKNGHKSSRTNSLNRNPVRARQLLLSGNSNSHLLHNDEEVDVKWKVIAAMPTAGENLSSVPRKKTKRNSRTPYAKKLMCRLFPSMKNCRYQISEPTQRKHIALAVADRKLISVSVIQRIAVAPMNGSVDTLPVCEENGMEVRTKTPLANMKAARCAFGAAAFEDKIIAVGGYNRGECLETSEIFDPVRNVWSALPSMSCPRGRFDIAVVDRMVYAVCGSDGTKDLQTAECYDFNLDAWQSIASLSTPRSSAGTCALDGRVLCVGGWSGQSVMKSVDAYDPAVDQWLPYAPLQTSRSQAGIDLLDGRIYVVGGSDNWDRLNTVEVYDPRQESWSFTAPLQIARRGAGVTHHKGYLYVIGGSDGTQSLCSVEIYDPRVNRWSSGQPLSISRANLEAVELNGRLFAIGGYSGKTFLNSMEVLHEDEWSEFISL